MSHTPVSIVSYPGWAHGVNHKCPSKWLILVFPLVQKFINSMNELRRNHKPASDFLAPYFDEVAVRFPPWPADFLLAEMPLVLEGMHIPYGCHPLVPDVLLLSH